MSPLLHGVIPILPTPFNAEEEIDFAALAACVRFAAECRFHAACLPAYGSEFYKLSEPERLRVIESAIAAAEGELVIVAQSNHPAARLAAGLARRHEEMGAGFISFAVPRLFELTERDVLDYCREVCDATGLPVLVQDFNPGGATVGASFAVELHRACPNFRYLKLEEPLLRSKVRAIIHATGGEVGVLSGWGGMHAMELIPEGICGLMPGLGVSDLLDQVWKRAYAGEPDSAMEVFERVLPSLVFSLQNLELWLFAEKKLLAARGIIPESSSHLRRGCRRPDAVAVSHALWLNDRLLKELDRLGLPRRPSPT